MKKVRAIALIIIGTIGILASFSFHTYGADYYNDVLSTLNWILRIPSLVIATIGTTNLIDFNKQQSNSQDQ